MFQSPPQVASFLGKTLYFLSFLPQFLAMAEPLQRLLKHGKPSSSTTAYCSRQLGTTL